MFVNDHVALPWANPLRRCKFNGCHVEQFGIRHASCRASRNWDCSSCCIWCANDVFAALNIFPDRESGPDKERKGDKNCEHTLGRWNAWFRQGELAIAHSNTCEL